MISKDLVVQTLNSNSLFDTAEFSVTPLLKGIWFWGNQAIEKLEYFGILN